MHIVRELMDTTESINVLTSMHIVRELMDTTESFFYKKLYYEPNSTWHLKPHTMIMATFKPQAITTMLVTPMNILTQMESYVGVMLPISCPSYLGNSDAIRSHWYLKICQLCQKETSSAAPESDIISSARKRHCATHTRTLSLSLSLSLAAPQLVDIAHS
jgi:hypothetical protein